jgi:hypothetical protein
MSKGQTQAATEFALEKHFARVVSMHGASEEDQDNEVKAVKAVKAVQIHLMFEGDDPNEYLKRYSFDRLVW